jgi:flagellar motility protein MotE (MotC chaperone)
MSNGYKEHFQKIQRTATGQSTGLSQARPAPQKKVSTAEDVRALLKAKQKARVRKPRPIPWSFVSASVIFSFMAGLAWMNVDSIEKFLDKVEVSMIGAARAEEKAPAAAPPGDSKPVQEGAAGASTGDAGPVVAAAPGSETEHLSRLRDRKVELDQREDELKRAEQELELQKQELEKRMVELEKTRTQISEVLKERAEVDDKKVDDLVSVYSTMKPIQAAKVFETMDEALAVKILGRMKKKPAAEILNLMKAEKAKMIAEKYAGYKRLTD